MHKATVKLKDLKIYKYLKIKFKYLFTSKLMYNTKVICTYNTPEVFLDDDDINEKEKEFIRDVIYRQELLDILGIEEYNEKELYEGIHELYKRVQNNRFLKECMIQLASKHLMNIDAEFGLTILCSYDYLYITHICVSEFLNKGKISEINMANLKSVID